MGGDGKPRSISVDTQLTTEEKIKQSVMQSFQSMIYSTEKRSNTPSLNVDDAATISRPYNSVDQNATEKLYGALSSNLSGLGRLTGQFEVYQYEMGLFGAIVPEGPKKRAQSGDGLMRQSTSLNLLCVSDPIERTEED